MTPAVADSSDWRSRLAICALAALAAIGWSRFAKGDPQHAVGLTVEGIERGFAGDQAGLQVGDVLESWRWGSDAHQAEGAFRSLLDLQIVEVEGAPQGRIRLTIRRDGAQRELVIFGDNWGVEARPAAAAAISGSTTTSGGAAADPPGYAPGGEDLESLEHRASDLSKRLSRIPQSELRTAVYEALEVARALVSAGADENAARLLVSVQDRIGPGGSVLPPLLAARVSDDLGWIYSQQGRFGEGAERLADALELARIAAPESLRTARIGSRLGLALRNAGDYETARPHLETANRLARALAPGSMTAVSASTNLGLLYYSQGRIDEATRHFDYAYEQVRDTGNAIEPKILNNLALSAHQASDLVRAEKYYRQAWELQRALEPGRCRDCAIYLYNLAGVERDRGNFGGAERYAREALRALDEAPKNPFRRAAVLSSLAENLLDLGRPQEAVSGLTEATGILRDVAPRAGFLVYNLSLLGNCLTELGQLDRAEALFAEALDLGAGISEKNQHHAYLLAGLGRLEEKRGRSRRAIEHLKRAVEQYRSLVADSVDIALLSHRIARLSLELGDVAPAADWSRAATEALLEASPKVGGTLISRSSFLGRTTEVLFFEVGRRLARGEREEAFELLESYRARVFKEVLSSRRLNLESRLPRDLLEARDAADRRYEEASRRLAEAEGEGEGQASEKWREAVAAARARREDVRAAVAVELERWTSGRDAEVLDYRQIRERTAPGTLLLSFAVGEERGYLFALGPARDDFEVHSIPLGRSRLQILVHQLRKALDATEPPELAIELANRLSGILVSEVARAAAAAERIVVLPDGPLYYLPFSLLADPNDESGRTRLGASKPLTIASSVARGRIPEPSAGGPGRGRFVLFGDPVYPGRPTTTSAGETQLVRSIEQGLRLDPLPETRREVQRLARLFGRGAETYLGSEATEENVKARLPDADLVHFATHALVNERFPLESALALSIPQAWREGQANGLLQAWEILEKMRLNADLVSLSACETGLGREFAGEGVIGLTRAFQLAGARAVLASLWKVSDVQSARFMEAFYRQLFVSGSTKAEALRAARAEAIDSADPGFSHPSVWAAFELYSAGS